MRVLAFFENFVRIETFSGIVLLVAAAAALIGANLIPSYDAFWRSAAPFAFLGHPLTLQFVINDGLMTVFFLVVGMEVRCEISQGSLANAKLASLPLAAALGGVVVPAALYLLVNHAGPASHGWAIPTATDIAFAVGVLGLLGKSIPGSVRALLLALAIIDDIVAVIVIALFYSGGLDFGGLAIVAAGVVLVLIMQRLRIDFAWAYVLPGAIVWGGFLKLGVHPTLAGVLLGLLTPVTVDARRAAAQPAAQAPALRVQSALHPWVAYGAMPLFALANAGVTLAGIDLGAGMTRDILLGIVLALCVGKPLGIVFGGWLAVKMGISRLPPQLDGRGLLLIGLLGGIGFTMSIFIATLAFDSAAALASAKTGVLLASTVAGVAGLIFGRAYAARLRIPLVVDTPESLR